jgi:hypothetical protein
LNLTKFRIPGRTTPEDCKENPDLDSEILQCQALYLSLGSCHESPARLERLLLAGIRPSWDKHLNFRLNGDFRPILEVHYGVLIPLSPVA